MNISGGKYNGRKILAPDEKITRPTLSKIRMSVFNALYSLLDTFENKTFLDMFGGSGIMGLEALSRGFSEVMVLEKNPVVAKIIEKNYKTIGLSANLRIGDSCKLLKNTEMIFDVIYIDPPYQSGIYEEAFISIENCVRPETIVIAEHLTELKLQKFELIKSKKYGDKFVSFFKLKE